MNMSMSMRLTGVEMAAGLRSGRLSIADPRPRTLITLVVPADSPLPVIGLGGSWEPDGEGDLVYRGDARWRRRADGKLEATYIREELELALAILGDEVCLECRGRPPCYSCRDRIIVPKPGD